MSLLAATAIFGCSAGDLQAQTLPSYLSVQRAGGSGVDLGTSLLRDAAGNFYSTGMFGGTVTFGSTTLTPPILTTGYYTAKQDAAGNYLWAYAFQKNSAGANEQFRPYTTLDTAANLYTTARFSGTFTLGGNTLTSSGSGANFSILVSKQATNGTFLWVKSFPDTSAATGLAAHAIARDAAGNIFVTGTFGGTVDFDPGPATDAYTSPTTGGMYILKLDSQGNYLWTRTIVATAAGSSFAWPIGLAVDESGNIYTTGYFTTFPAGSFIDFDPGAGSNNLAVAGPGTHQHWISKLDASGNHVWTHRIGNSSNLFNFKAMDLFVDSTAVYATGWFDGTADFDPGAGTANMTAVNRDAYFLKLDTAGNYIWARQITGNSLEYISDVERDSAGNFYLTGVMDDTADLDPGAGVANLVSGTTVANANNAFVAKWDDQGNYIDAILIGGGGTDNAEGMELTVNNTGTEVHLIGRFGGTVDFNPSAASNTLTSSGTADIFFLKLAPSTPLPVTLSAFNAYRDNNKAQLTWTTASETGSKGFVVQRSEDARNWQQIGYVNSRAENGNSARTLEYRYTDNAPVKGANYYRLAMAHQNEETEFSTVRLVTFGDHTTIQVYPNPTKDKLYFSGLKGGEVLTVYTVTGQAQYSRKVDQAGVYELPMQSLSKGLYYIKITANDGAAQTIKVVME